MPGSPAGSDSPGTVMTGDTPVDLDQAILEAHQRGDGRALSALYLRVAAGHAEAGREDAAGFFFTQSLVFALDAGDETTAHAARAELVRLGRDR